MAHSVEASAPAKLILCGEHAVVYGRPAIAVPLSGVRATVTIAHTPGCSSYIYARDLGRSWLLDSESEHPFSLLVYTTLAALGAEASEIRITIRSAIPTASGMGSGAAIATALVRALAAYCGQELASEAISALVYQSERHFHGTPSGIDNTVIAFERPIWFVRRISDSVPSRTPLPPIIEPLALTPFTLLVADTGVRSPTKLPVGEVRRRSQAEPARYQALFDAIAEQVVAVRSALAQGAIKQLGPLFTRNHELLQALGVSSPELDRLVTAALAAGASGAKLSGAGWGGVMFALVTEANHDQVAAALRAAGAAAILETSVV